MRKETGKGNRKKGNISRRFASGGFRARPIAPLSAKRARHSIHVNWVAAISAKFEQKRAWHGMARGSLIDLLIPRRLRNISTFFSRALHHYHRPTIHNSFGGTKVECLPWPGSHAGPIGRGATIELASKQASAHVIREVILRSLSNLPLVLSDRRRPLPVKADSGRHAVRPALFPSTVGRIVLAATPASPIRSSEYIAAGAGSAAAPIDQIARKHRRTESLRVGLTEGPATGLPSTRPFGARSAPQHELARPASRRRAPEAVAGRASGVGAASPGASHPAVNVTRLADEVIKQLDRRLVAARERMGRT